MATMTMRHTAAHQWAFMGRAIFMAASSWAWALGPTGAMVTAGAIIASAAAAEGPTVAAVETKGGASLPAIVDAAYRERAGATIAHHAAVPRIPQRHAVARPTLLLTPQPRAAARPVALPERQPRVAAHPTVAVADHMVADHTVADPMAVPSRNSR